MAANSNLPENSNRDKISSANSVPTTPIHILSSPTLKPNSITLNNQESFGKLKIRESVKINLIDSVKLCKILPPLPSSFSTSILNSKESFSLPNKQTPIPPPPIPPLPEFIKDVSLLSPSTTLTSKATQSPSNAHKPLPRSLNECQTTDTSSKTILKVLDDSKNNDTQRISTSSNENFDGMSVLTSSHNNENETGNETATGSQSQLSEPSINIITKELEQNFIVDRFGFVKTKRGPAQSLDTSSTNSHYDKRHISQHTSSSLLSTSFLARQTLLNEQKWLRMLANQSKFSKKREAKKLKRRVRRGIPDSLRGKVWYLLSNAEALRQREVLDVGNSSENGNVDGLGSTFLTYMDLLHRTIPKDIDSTIQRDLNRTFPKHILFYNGTGQNSLYKILKAYAAYDPQLGYCQGMGFVAAVLLMYMNEEEAFQVLVALMHGKYKLHGCYLYGLPKLLKRFFQFEELMKKHCPKLAKYFDEKGIPVMVFSSHQFITIYSHSIPFDFVVRVQDIFLNEGYKILFRIGLAILLNYEEQLLKLETDEIPQAFKRIQAEIAVDPDRILRRAVRIKLSHSELEKLSQRYYAENGNKASHKSLLAIERGKSVRANSSGARTNTSSSSSPLELKLFSKLRFLRRQQFQPSIPHNKTRYRSNQSLIAPQSSKRGGSVDITMTNGINNRNESSPNTKNIKQESKKNENASEIASKATDETNGVLSNNNTAKNKSDEEQNNQVNCDNSSVLSNDSLQPY